MSRQQGFLGAGEVSLMQPDPSQLVQRPSQLAPQIGAQFLARHQCLPLGVVARPAQAEDLGAVHPTASVEAADGVRLAPSLHRLGPLLGHVIQGEALQGAHQLAIDDPRRERIELSRDRRHPGLVEQRQPLGDIAVQDEQTGFCDAADGARRRVTPRTHLDGLPGPLAGAGHVAGQHPLIGADDRQPGVRRRLIVTFEQSLRTCQPAAHRCHQRGVEEQMHRQTDGRTCGRDTGHRPACRRRGRAPTPRRSHRDGRPRTRPHQAPADRRGQKVVSVRLHQQVERLLPVPLSRSGTGALDDAKTSVIAHRTLPNP